jgi:integrase/recombinase XerD
LEADLPLDKSGRVHIVGSVPLLHPEAQPVDEMLKGWRNQQMRRSPSHDTSAGRIRLVEIFAGHTSEFPQKNSHSFRHSPRLPRFGG